MYIHVYIHIVNENVKTKYTNTYMHIYVCVYIYKIYIHIYVTIYIRSYTQIQTLHTHTHAVRTVDAWIHVFIFWPVWFRVLIYYSIEYIGEPVFFVNIFKRNNVDLSWHHFRVKRKVDVQMNEFLLLQKEIVLRPIIFSCIRNFLEFCL